MQTDFDLIAKTREQVEKYLSTCDEYTTPYEHEKLVRNWLKKEQVAENLVQDFMCRAGDLPGKRMLELGFGSGLHIPAFANAGAEMYGLEVNEVLLEIAKENMRLRNVSVNLQSYGGSDMPYSDNYFDYVFATSVLEHVSDVQKVLREVDRILKPGGRFYVSFPNRWAPRETHTGFWFVQYFPRRVVEIILRMLGSNATEELNLHFLSYFSFKRYIEDTNLFIIFETDAQSGLRQFLKKILAAIGIHHSALLKTVMVVVEKAKITAHSDA